MLSEPRIEARTVQPYVAIRREVKMGDIGPVLPPLHDSLLAWLNGQGVQPTGAPFFRYHLMDMDADRFVVDVGWPIAEPVTGEGEMFGDTLPAGQYAVILNTGPFDDLVSAHAALLEWGQAQCLTWQRSEDGKTWGARVEHYITDPADEPDPQQWKTEVAFLVAER